jgi:hypothetical protein
MLERTMKKIFLYLFFLLWVISPSLGQNLKLICGICGTKVEEFPRGMAYYFLPLETFEQDIQKTYPSLFTSATPITCPNCGYTKIDNLTVNPSKKDIIKKYLKKEKKIKNIDFKTNPCLQFVYAAKFSALNLEPNIVIGKCYHLAALSFKYKYSFMLNKLKYLFKQAMKLNQIIPFKVVNQLLYPEPAELMCGHGIKPQSAKTNAIFAIRLENIIRDISLPDNELAAVYYGLLYQYYCLNDYYKAEKYYQLFCNTQVIKKLQSLSDDDLHILDLYELKNLPKEIKNLLNENRYYFQLAKKYYLLAIEKENFTNKEKIALYYLIAEIERKLGNFKNAEKYYNLVINNHETDDYILDNIIFIYKKCLNKQSFELDKRLYEIDKENLEKIFEELINNPNKLSETAKRLRYYKNRDLIFQKLKTLIETGDKRLIENAVYLMTDRTQEAVDLQVDLLKKGKCIDYILRSSNSKLKNNANLIKKTDDYVFIDIFNQDPVRYKSIISFFLYIDTDNCRKTIIQKSKEAFSEDAVKEYIKSYDSNLLNYHQALLNALTFIRTKESIEIIINLLSYLKDNYSDINKPSYADISFLVNSVGKALEIAFNKSFGFTRTIEQRPYGKYPQRIKYLGFNTAYKRFHKWYVKFVKSGKSLEKIVADGFKTNGYVIEPKNDVNTLKELITGLNDAFEPIKVNSYRELVKKTGIIYENHNNDHYRIFNLIEEEPDYIEWFEENKNKLVFDKEKQMFTTKSEFENN